MSVFGLGSNAIAEELTMATDKDTTTRTAKDAAEDVTRATRGQTAKAADTGKKVARDAADTAERGAETAARTAERGAEVAQNVADRGAQTLRSTTKKATETVSKLTDDAAKQVTEQVSQQFGRVFSLQAKASEEVANRTQQNLDVLLQTSSVLAEGFQ